jgi:transcriptional regulator with XRE-family HTH domain
MANFDTMVLGRRVRAARRRVGLTLAELGEVVGKPAPYLSQLENGKVEPKMGLVSDLAAALRCTPAELMEVDAPSRRAELEIELLRLQRLPHYHAWASRRSAHRPR